jgi:hypothetical protein
MSRARSAALPRLRVNGWWAQPVRARELHAHILRIVEACLYCFQHTHKLILDKEVAVAVVAEAPRRAVCCRRRLECR